MFVQVIESGVSDPEGMRRHFFAGVERLHPTAVGWLGATSGISSDGRWLNIIRFESEVNDGSRDEHLLAIGSGTHSSCDMDASTSWATRVSAG